MKIEVRDAQQGAWRCVFCREPLTRQEATPCPSCETALHEECWGELQGCPTAGCGQPCPGEASPRERHNCTHCEQPLPPGEAGFCEDCWELLQTPREQRVQVTASDRSLAKALRDEGDCRRCGATTRGRTARRRGLCDDCHFQQRALSIAVLVLGLLLSAGIVLISLSLRELGVGAR